MKPAYVHWRIPPVGGGEPQEYEEETEETRTERLSRHQGFNGVARALRLSLD